MFGDVEHCVLSCEQHSFADLSSELDNLEAYLRELVYLRQPLGARLNDDIHLVEAPDSLASPVDLEALSSQEVDSDIADDVQSAGLLDRPLDDARRCIAKSLFCLSDWVLWKSRGYNDSESCEALEARFDYGHIGRSSSGWCYIDDDFDDFDEQESNDSQAG